MEKTKIMPKPKCNRLLLRFPNIRREGLLLLPPSFTCLLNQPKPNCKPNLIFLLLLPVCVLIFVLFAPLFRKSPKNPKPSRNNNNTSSAEFVGFGVKTLDMLKSEAQPNNTTSTLYPPRPASSSSRSAPSSPKRKLDEIVDQKQMEECNPTAKRRSTSPTLESVTSTPPPPSSLNPLPAVRSTEESEEEDVEIDIVGDCEPINHIVQLSVATHEQFWSDADEEDMKSFGLLEKATITEAINDEDEKEFSQWLSD